jgi:hypothetical protein
MLAEPAIGFVEPQLRFVVAERNDLARVRLENLINVLDTEAFVFGEPL